MSKLSAVYAMNNYVWQLLYENGVMSKIGGKVPFNPGTMPPEWASQTSPFIIYGFSRGSTRDMYFWEHENVAYTIWAGGGTTSQSTAATRVTDIAVVIHEALSRHDISAYDINRWIRRFPAYNHIMFTNVMVASIQGPGAEVNENGKVDGLVVVNYSFTSKRDIETYDDNWAVAP
jgi:hypothetical protein